MQQNFSQSIKMQMPHENRYTGLEIIPREEDSLREFLEKNYEFPSNNLDEIHKFISTDSKLEKIIISLPEIVSKEFKDCQICIDFMKYTFPNEIVLKIGIKTPYDAQTSSNKQNIILNEIFKYESPEKDYFITMEF